MLTKYFSILFFSTLAFQATAADHAALTMIEGKEYCRPFTGNLAFAYDYSYNGHHKYNSVEVLDVESKKSDVYQFLGRQGSNGKLIFKAKSRNLNLGQYFYATDYRGGGNTVGFIKAMDEIGNVIKEGQKIEMTYNISSSYKVWVYCY